jgi:hypothetical protein
MRFILAVIITVLLAWALHFVLPWWAIVIAGLVTGAAIQTKSGFSFLASFLGGIILWGGMAIFINSGNDGILSDKIGELFGNIGTVGIISVTTFFGGFLAGLGGLTGNLFRQSIKKG